MCGLAGVYHPDGAPVDPSLIHRMTSIMTHRGPDGAGSYIGDGIALGHRRLSIIDIASGAQPMTNEDGTLQLIFNGEIYNYLELRNDLITHGHLFKTRSDTEVIVHAYEQWGVDCVSLFNGIFAFALWDSRTKRLVLARDHLGVKPLYYTELPKGRVLFASEIKALLEDPACPRNVDLRSLEELLTLRYVLSPNTLFEGIKKLPPGHLMLLTPDGVTVQRYWNWTPNLLDTYDEEQMVEQYRGLVEDAVRLQMRSDVPVGLWLSSGIDSGALLAMMRNYTNQPVRTFTIGFEDGERSNETEDAARMAAMFEADHSQMIVGPKDYERYFERHLWDLEEPLANETAAAFYFVSVLSSRKVKVVLSGQGADEPWAGYHRYIGVTLSDYYRRFPEWLTKSVVAAVVGRIGKHERLRRGALSLYERDDLSRLINIYSLYTAGMRRQLLRPEMRSHWDAGSDVAKNAVFRLHKDVRHLDSLTQMTYIDTRANLPDDLLMVADKSAMANSVEARVPFLDYRLIEFIERLPPSLKLRRFKGKYLHKKAAEKWLPKTIVNRKKKGFDNPVEAWLRGSMRKYIGDCLLSDGAAVHRYFSRDYIKQLVAQHESNGFHLKRQIYLLIQFELWHRQFMRN